MPLRVRCRPPGLAVGQALARLPWESLPLNRPIWRLGSKPGPLIPHAERPVRSPRLLLLIGNDSGLDLDAEVQELQQLSQRGQLHLTTLRGRQSSLAELSRQLHDRQGWDGLVYLGHSDTDPQGGGRLQLGDGRWLTGLELRRELEQSQDPACRPLFVLLNSCLGLDLADSCLDAGVSWVMCFRELVPSNAASLAFCYLLQRLRDGAEFMNAVVDMRQRLLQSGPSGCHLLLSVVCADAAQPLRLPLSRQSQFWQRLASSSRAQAIAAGVCVAAGMVMDLSPSLPPGPWLLDQRLEWQRRWRSVIGEAGPSRQPVEVLLIDNGPTAAALGGKPTPNRMPRQALTAVLKQVPPALIPVVGFDVVLDEPAPYSSELAAVLRVQRARRVFAGYFSRHTGGVNGVGKQRSLPLQELQDSGLRAYALDTGIAGPRRDGAFPLPLRLDSALGADTFAHAIAAAQQPYRQLQELPYDAVIDWSLDWSTLVSNVQVAQLKTLRSPVLLVGADSTINRQDPDQFMAPRAISGALENWNLGVGRLPGPILQAVLAQSMAMAHWLTPGYQTPSTALTSGLGVLLAAALDRRRQRGLMLLALTAASIPLSLQLAVSQRFLLPMALPILALTTTALIRHD
ncbi:MAG: CHAT domain-containing protein [Cyanobacteriota bacterium]|nr:CHAT domain-containing protein [Cyanobacteriota bacterium]